jgi:hypothetical protein
MDNKINRLNWGNKMIRIAQTLVCLTFFVFSLTSCALFQNNKEQNREAVCRELNHRIIFNGATPNQSVAMQQRAEMETLTKDYRAEGCS